MNTPLENFLLKHGIKPCVVCQEHGFSQTTFHQHRTGKRKVSPEMAIRYEEALGIPRWEFRPDIWESPPQADDGCCHAGPGVGTENFLPGKSLERDRTGA